MLLARTSRAIYNVLLYHFYIAIICGCYLIEASMNNYVAMRYNSIHDIHTYSEEI